ncbi:hypothetical protein GGS21DRAFT_175524 [Xylaria nigripes]|nr:hypothetical protein GGS21DRAFT_175524 [Xylaria nigripes]
MSVEYTGPSATPRTSPKTPARASPYPTNTRGGDRQTENSTGNNSQSHGGDLQQIPLRSLGVHTILNPAETQLPLSSGRADENARDIRAPNAKLNSSPQISPPFVFHGQSMARHGYTTPTLEDQPPTAPSSAERNSPSTPRPYPPIAAARRVLTPRSPQFISPGQRTLSQPQPQHLPIGSQDSSRVASEAPGRPDQSLSTRSSPLGQQFSRVVSPAGRAPPNMAPSPASRPMSQPLPNHSDPNLQGRPYFSPEGPGVQQGQHPGFPQHNPYAPVMHPTHSGFQGPAGDPRWPGGNEHALPYGPGGVRNFAFGEGQAALRIQPAHGEPFIVPVDTHQGSRQADEKRQRNAGASQRFRKRKKDRETQERLEHQRMENQYREMEARIQALESDRDRLRSDRDRLRDIVYRTPSVCEFAYQGPPSPDANNSSSSSPLGPRPTTTYGASDPETGERASQRRRTDPQVDFTNSPYVSAPGSLPPITTSGYPTSISHPGTPSTRPQAPQLPPLRLGSAAGTPTTGASGASTPVQACQQLKREQYETGWVTTPRTSADPLQR